ncbi:MAG TPA: hypothetical protein VFC41_05435 [Anaerovoracaceae bacterium]|nr:hypothetical protein [Anaerovoracaceae bacterium]
MELDTKQKGIQLLTSGMVNTKELVSHVIPITEWEEAFKMFESKEGMKPILIPVEK